MIKGRPRFGKGFAYTPARTRNYEKALKLNLMEFMRSNNYNALTGPVNMTVQFQMLAPKKPANPFPAGDLDNYVKAFLDAANEVLFLDDKQVVSMVASKTYVVNSPLEGIFFKVSEQP